MLVSTELPFASAPQSPENSTETVLQSAALSDTSGADTSTYVTALAGAAPASDKVAATSAVAMVRLMCLSTRMIPPGSIETCDRHPAASGPACQAFRANRVRKWGLPRAGRDSPRRFRRQIGLRFMRWWQRLISEEGSWLVGCVLLVSGSGCSGSRCRCGRRGTRLGPRSACRRAPRRRWAAQSGGVKPRLSATEQSVVRIGSGVASRICSMRGGTKPRSRVDLGRQPEHDLSRGRRSTAGCNGGYGADHAQAQADAAARRQAAKLHENQRLRRAVQQSELLRSNHSREHVSSGATRGVPRRSGDVGVARDDLPVALRAVPGRAETGAGRGICAPAAPLRKPQREAEAASRTTQGHGDDQRTPRRGRRPRGARSLGRRPDPRLVRVRLRGRHAGRTNDPVRDAAAPARRTHRGHRAGGDGREDGHPARAATPVTDLGPRQPRWPTTSRSPKPPACRSTSATPTRPGSAAPTRTPTDCCASTSPRARICPSTGLECSTTSLPSSTGDPARPSTGAPRPKPSTQLRPDGPDHRLRPRCSLGALRRRPAGRQEPAAARGARRPAVRPQARQRRGALPDQGRPDHRLREGPRLARQAGPHAAVPEVPQRQQGRQVRRHALQARQAGQPWYANWRTRAVWKAGDHKLVCYAKTRK